MAVVKVLRSGQDGTGQLTLTRSVRVAVRPEIPPRGAGSARCQTGRHSLDQDRAMVSGGGVKPWRQGTGRARAGSNRSRSCGVAARPFRTPAPQIRF